VLKIYYKYIIDYLKIIENISDYLEKT